MSEDIVPEIKGKKPWTKNDPGYWLQSGLVQLPCLAYSSAVSTGRDQCNFFELTGSTPQLMFINPISLLFETGLSGSGAILIRELVRRRGLGWSSIFL